MAGEKIKQMATNSIAKLGCRSPIIALAIAISIVQPAFANHGPGTSGGGSSTASGETLRAGMVDLDFRFDFTEFQHISRAQAEARAVDSGDFDTIKRAAIGSISLSYGLTDDWQIGAQLGYYQGWDFISATSIGGGEAESGTGDPNGLTDLWLTSKYRLLKGAPGNLAVIGGIKLPTGRDDVRLSNGELLEASSQPGTGAVDFQAGLAYSRFLTSRLTVDASAIYTFRTDHNDFKVGDRLDLGLALAYRLTESIKDFPNVSVFGEALGVWLGKDRDGDEFNPNSGGSTMYLSPGVRVRWNEHVALTLASAFPVVQELNGDQVETRFKLALTLSFTF